MQHACIADQGGAQELFFFIKQPSNFIFFLFSGFTLNTGWQAATERENALSTYVCTLFPCITRRIFYRRMCCYHARSLLHTRFMLDVIFYSAHHPTRVLLQTYRSFPRYFFHALFQDTQIAPRFTHVYLLHTYSHMCIAEICPYKQTNLHSGTREQSVCAFVSFICWPKHQICTSNCRIKIIAICLPASQLIIKIFYAFDFLAIVSSFLFLLVFDDAFMSVSLNSSLAF